MPGLSRRLKQLDEELLALGEETMLLEELDGFAYPFVGLLTGFGPAATINSEPLSDLALPFRHPVD